MKKYKLLGILIIMLLGFISCQKEFLEEKPDSRLTIPGTLEDFQYLLDNSNTTVSSPMSKTPELGELSSDDYYLQKSRFDIIGTKARNAYIWASDIYEGQGVVFDWNDCYQQVFVANIVLEGLEKMSDAEKTSAEWKRIKGSALFIRAYAFFNLAVVFSTTYDSASASQDLGIPLRLESDINPVSVRASVKETYDQIIKDLSDARGLLFNNVDFENPNRPSRPAVFALLSRVHLSIRSYKSALEYSDSCLAKHNKLIDYNTLSTTLVTPFVKLHDEAIYQSRLSNSGDVFLSSNTDVNIDSSLYKSYATNDLRKIIFFRLNTSGIPYRKNGYSATSVLFTGLATDEILLIRAECYARNGNIINALKDLNDLLIKRWKKGTFTSIDSNNPNEVLSIIQTERRKELVFRGIRWSDLKRYNKEGANIILKRVIGGQEYILLPNDKKYVLPIPPDEIAISKIPQNIR